MGTGKEVLLLATGNLHKLREFSDLFTENQLSVQVKDFASLGIQPNVKETGTTYMQNASLKASAAFELTGLPVLADDSGLEVLALGGAPGVYSARYAGENATDAENRDKLLMALQGHSRRQARFVCVLCYRDALGESFFVGSVTGSISNKPMGKDGFGYDPLFIPGGYNLTFAEMYSEEKNAISHRARAVQSFAEWWRKK